MASVSAEAAYRRLQRQGWVEVPNSCIDGTTDAFLALLLAHARAAGMIVAYRTDHHRVLVVDCEA